MVLLTQIRLGLLGVVFPLPASSYSRRTYLIYVYNCWKIYLKYAESEKCWHNLLLADVISIFVTRKRHNIYKIYKNWWKWLILTEEFFITFQRCEEFQWSFQEKCDLWYFLKVAKSQSSNLSLEDIFFELTTAATLGLSKNTISLASRFLNDLSQ